MSRNEAGAETGNPPGLTVLKPKAAGPSRRIGRNMLDVLSACRGFRFKAK